MFYKQQLNAATETKEYSIFKENHRRRLGIQEVFLKWVWEKAVKKEKSKKKKVITSCFLSLIPKKGIIFWELTHPGEFPVVRTWYFHTSGLNSVPGMGNTIPQTSICICIYIYIYIYIHTHTHTHTHSICINVQCPGFLFLGLHGNL